MFVIWTGQKLSLLVVETMIHLSYGNFSYSLEVFKSSSCFASGL